MNLIKRPGNKADGFIMHVTKNIIGLRAPGDKGTILQIFNLDTKEKLRSIDFPEEIIFWRWLNESILGVVTRTSVYHVDITPGHEKEQKIFDRSGDLTEGQIIGYVLANGGKWCALFGISSPDGGQTINGHIQLYLI